MKSHFKLNWMKFLATIASLVALTSTALAQLPTVEEALEISQQTGRPIFALAGQKS
jgi:hypothetical protein